MKKLVQSFGFALGVKASSACKLSFVVGSHMIWLSPASILVPLTGAFGGILGASVVCVIRMIVHCIIFKTLALSSLAFFVPGYCASIYWATSSSVIRFFLPLACMVLFIAHPIGGQAFLYSLYWLIPVVLFFIPRQSLFLNALGSTFVAHAVGSVIWLYTVPMSAAIWLSLIPVVAVERLLFACSMVVLYNIAAWVKNLNVVSALFVRKSGLTV